MESRGRPDMAVQLWQQILLSDPNNTEAFAGLAQGSTSSWAPSIRPTRRSIACARSTPTTPTLPKSRPSQHPSQSDQLRQAGDLARQGKLDDAMGIYRQLYGDHPPDGDIALAYYQTLYGTPNGKESRHCRHARAGRSAIPAITRFAIALGVMLTYDGRTRAEGIRILQAHPRTPMRRPALRQALIWDAANPSSADELREYLKAHPQDAEVAGHLRTE